MIRAVMGYALVSTFAILLSCKLVESVKSLEDKVERAVGFSLVVLGVLLVLRGIYTVNTFNGLLVVAGAVILK